MDAVKAVVAVVKAVFTKEVVKRIAVAVAVNALSRMLQPKSKDKSADRSSRFAKQRDSSPYRDIILGTAITGGTFIDAIAYSTDNMFYCEIIKLADHECDGLVAAYAGGRQLTINGDGSVQEYIESGTPRMWIYFQAGAWGETTHSEVLTAFGGRYTSSDRGRGVCRVILKCDMRSDKLFPSRSPPDLTFAVRGAKIYSPRLDTSLGGSHVWGTYATYAWTDNLADIAYNVARGIFVYGGASPERLAGGSYDSEELPLAQWAAESTACEVAVSLKAGGTERRYRGGLLFSTNEELEGILADLAAGAAGFMLDLGGTLIFQAGIARTPVATLTDADFIAGKLRRTWRQSARERFNTVTGRFTDPALRYQQNTLPIRRSTSDITADNNEERVETMSLGVVQSQTQGQRVMEIRRRSNRLNSMFQVDLPPAWQHLEAGDWVTYTSARRGWTKTFVLLPAEIKTTGEDMLVSSLSMVEVSSNVYTWTPASDELDVTNPATVGPGSIPDATISGFSAVASANTATNESAPAIEVAWTVPSDPTIDTVAIDYKRPAAGTWLTQSFDAKLGAGQITGLASGSWQVRARPITTPLRPGTASGTVTVTLTQIIAGQAGAVPWDGVTGDGKPDDNATVGGTIGTDIRFPDTTIAPIGRVDNAYVPAYGANLVRYSRTLDTSKHALGFNNTGFSAPLTYGVSFDEGYVYRQAVGTVAGASSLAILHSYALNRFVVAGLSRVEASVEVYMTTNNAIASTAWGIIYFYDSAGTQVGSSFFDSTTLQGGWIKVEEFVTVPGTAKFAIMAAQIDAGAGSINPFIGMRRAFCGAARADQTAFSPYVVGSESDQGADVTEDNVAGGYLGQGNQSGKNTYRQSTAPSSPAQWDEWQDTSVSPVLIKVRLSGVWVTIAEEGSDITAQAVPSVEGPKSISFDVDAGGALSPGSQVPRTLQFIRKRGNTDVSTSTTWTIVSPVNITLGTITNGGVNVTAIAAGLSNFTVRSVRDGVTIDYLVEVNKNTIAAGVTPPDIVKGDIVDDNTLGYVSSTSWTDVLSANLPNCPGGYFETSGFYSPASATGNVTVEVRLTVNGTQVGSVFSGKVFATGGVVNLDDLSDVLGQFLAIGSGNKTVALQFRAPSTTGSINTGNGQFVVNVIPTT